MHHYMYQLHADALACDQTHDLCVRTSALIVTILHEQWWGCSVYIQRWFAARDRDKIKKTAVFVNRVYSCSN